MNGEVSTRDDVEIIWIGRKEKNERLEVSRGFTSHRIISTEKRNRRSNCRNLRTNKQMNLPIEISD